MKQGRIVDDMEIKGALVDRRPWRRWIEENLIELDKLPTPAMSISPIMTACWSASMHSATPTKTETDPDADGRRRPRRPRLDGHGYAAGLFER